MRRRRGAASRCCRPVTLTVPSGGLSPLVIHLMQSVPVKRHSRSTASSSVPMAVRFGGTRTRNIINRSSSNDRAAIPRTGSIPWRPRGCWFRRLGLVILRPVYETSAAVHETSNIDIVIRIWITGESEFEWCRIAACPRLQQPRYILRQRRCLHTPSSR